MKTEGRSLSSKPATYFVRWGFPILALGPAVSFVWFLVISPFLGRSAPEPLHWNLALLVMFAFVVLGFSLYCAHLYKMVNLDRDNLVIGSAFRTICVPLRHVVDVYELWGGLGRNRIKIVLDTDTVFGRAIIFIPHMNWRTWQNVPHPVVDEIRASTPLIRDHPKRTRVAFEWY